MSCASAKRISVVELAGAGEHHAAGIAAGRDHPGELAARDDVETGAARRQHAEHREVAVRLHRVADARALTGECCYEGVVARLERGA
jgi:hypothetical protein